MKLLKIIIPVLVVIGVGVGSWWWISNHGVPWKKTTASLSDASKVADDDADGLPLDLERVFKTDPAKFDTDGDGYGDGEELFNGYNPIGKGALDPMTVTDALTLDDALSGRRDAECLLKVTRTDSDLDVLVRLYLGGAKFRQELYPLQRGVPAANNLILIRNGDTVYFGTNAKPKEWIQLSYSEKDGLAKNSVLSLEGQTLLTKKSLIDDLKPKMTVCFGATLDAGLFEVPTDSILSEDELKKEAENNAQNNGNSSQSNQ